MSRLTIDRLLFYGCFRDHFVAAKQTVKQTAQFFLSLYTQDVERGQLHCPKLCGFLLGLFVRVMASEALYLRRTEITRMHRINIINRYKIINIIDIYKIINIINRYKIINIINIYKIINIINIYKIISIINRYKIINIINIYKIINILMNKVGKEFRGEYMSGIHDIMTPFDWSRCLLEFSVQEVQTRSLTLGSRWSMNDSQEITQLQLSS